MNILRMTIKIPFFFVLCFLSIFNIGAQTPSENEYNLLKEGLYLVKVVEIDTTVRPAELLVLGAERDNQEGVIQGKITFNSNSAMDSSLIFHIFQSKSVGLMNVDRAGHLIGLKVGSDENLQLSLVGQNTLTGADRLVRRLDGLDIILSGLGDHRHLDLTGRADVVSSINGFFTIYWDILQELKSMKSGQDLLKYLDRQGTQGASRGNR